MNFDYGSANISFSDNNPSTIPAFLSKLWALVEDSSTDDLICWDVSGKSFHVLDQIRFAREILPRCFKHNNIASFIRQLNMYGFRKIMSTDMLNMKSEREDLTFAHQYFIRGQEALLEQIKRKTTNTQSQNLSTLSKKDVSKIMGEVSSLKFQFDSMADTLENLKIENEVLWKEVVNLRQKHARQHQVVSKLVQFFASFVNKERNQTTIKRKLPLMIKGSECNEVEPQKDNDFVTIIDCPPVVDSPKQKKVTVNTSSNTALEPLAVGSDDDQQQPIEIADIIDLQSPININSNISDAASKFLMSLNKNLTVDASDAGEQSSSPSKKLVSAAKHEPRLVYKDFDKEEFSRNLNSFQNSLDSLYDLLNNGQYNLDANSLFTVFNNNETSHDNNDADDSNTIRAKRQKLSTDDSSGKELIHYTPPEDFLNFGGDIWGDGTSDSISNSTLQKSDDIPQETLSPMVFLDEDYNAPLWPPELN